MKKLMILLLLSVTSFAQKDFVAETAKIGKEVLVSTGDAIKATGNWVDSTTTKIDTSSVTRFVANKIVDGVEALATGLKIGSEKVFEVYTMKNRIDGISGIIFFILGVVFLIFFGKKTINFIREKNLDILTYIPLTIIVFLFTNILIKWFIEGQYISKAFVPEYYTIQTIIDTVKAISK